MAGLHFLRSPTSSVQSESVVDIAARIAVIIVAICFVVFLSALRTPKAPTSRACDVQLLQHAPAGHKRKGGKAKKNKKARAAVVVTKCGPAAADIPEELEVGKGSSVSETDRSTKSELEIGKVSSVSEADRPTEPIKLILSEQAPGSFSSLVSCHDCPVREARLAPEVDDDPVARLNCSCVTTSITKLETSDHLEMRAPHVDCPSTDLDLAPVVGLAEGGEDTGFVCDKCRKHDVHLWGCSAHRTYTSALLLMHRNMQLAAATGPPGLDLPVTASPAWKSGVCGLRTI